MRCPSCRHNHKLSLGMKCGSCGYTFVFDPKTDKMSDGRWKALINAVSGNDTYYFTANQLFSILSRSVRKKPERFTFYFLSTLFLLLGSGFAFAISQVTSATTDHTTGAVFLRIVLFVGLVVLLVRNNLSSTHALPPSYDTFKGHLKKWEARHPTEKLLEGPSLHTPPPEWSEEDIYDYGIEALLIVDEERLVDLLVLNGFHAEQRCAIIASSGYPEYILPHVKKALSTRSNLPVFALHAATIEGRKLPYTLKDLGLGIDEHPITDLGWSSADFLDISQLRLFDIEHWEGATSVDILPPRQLHSLLASAMRESVPLSAFMGREEAAGAWTSDGDRLWVDVSDYG